MKKNIAIVLGAILVLFIVLVLSSDNTPVTENDGTAANINLTAGPVVGSVKSETLGEYLTDTKGMTLYVFSDDKKLQSVCKDACLQKWPPFAYDSKDPASFTDTLSKRMNVIERSDGAIQYAYGEKPVYYYVGDKAPGEVNGNGLNDGKWSIVVITQ